jgi:cobalt-precorrin-5B (C1)-methyltransferase
VFRSLLTDLSQPGLVPTRCGYTLPVWLAAAARAALVALLGEPFEAQQPLLLSPAVAAASPAGESPAMASTVAASTAGVPASAAALLADGWALGEARCDPGAVGLDLTRGLVVWALVRWRAGDGPWLELQAGEGVGVHERSGEPCLSDFARRLLELNLRPLLPRCVWCCRRDGGWRSAPAMPPSEWWMGWP